MLSVMCIFHIYQYYYVWQRSLSWLCGYAFWKGRHRGGVTCWTNIVTCMCLSTSQTHRFFPLKASLKLPAYVWVCLLSSWLSVSLSHPCSADAPQALTVLQTIARIHPNFPVWSRIPGEECYPSAFLFISKAVALKHQTVVWRYKSGRFTGLFFMKLQQKYPAYFQLIMLSMRQGVTTSPAFWETVLKSEALFCILQVISNVLLFVSFVFLWNYNIIIIKKM